MITSDIQVFYIAIKKHGPIFGVDFGTKKLGVAMSNNELTFAIPLCVIEADIKKIKPMVDLHKPRGIVLGMPMNMDGSFGAQAILVKKFAVQILDAFGLPVLFQDERFTSRAASNVLKIFGFKRKERDKIDDKVAACMILETAMSGMRLLSVTTSE